MKNSSNILKIVILIPIIFLLVYHIFKLYNIYFGDDLLNSNDFLNSFQDKFPIGTVILFQNFLRVLIALSLLIILFRINIGILGMWIGIGTLIITQFIIVSQSDNELINTIHAGLKPLKGLILPIIITFLYRKTN